MAKHLSSEKIEKIKFLRSRGHSLSEISKILKIGQGTVFRYVKGVVISGKYKRIWLDKRQGSVKRKELAEKKAKIRADDTIKSISNKERLLILSSLYWAEGAKVDFNLTNTDSDLIRTFIICLKDVLGLSNDRLRLNIRIYEDMDSESCIKFWLDQTGLTINNLSSVNVLSGKKLGKLKYGMCRVRVTKGGDVLKYLVAVRRRIIKLVESPHSSTDRASAS
jgi:hypothetical protein